MSISPKQAAEALNDVARAQQRTSTLRGYEQGAPYFILWGVIWAVGFGLSDVAPARAGLIWLAVSLIGQVGSILVARAAVASGRFAGTRPGLSYVACGATVVAFSAATYYVMAAHTLTQFGAFPALVMAAAYTLFGIWRGIRWAVAGIFLGVCTLTGFVLFPTHFNLWMATIGGGTLLLTGYWLRRA